MSIIGVAKANGERHNAKKFWEICKTWIITFPVCGGIAYGLAVAVQLIAKFNK